MTLFGPDLSSFQRGISPSAHDLASTSFMLWRSVREKRDPDGVPAAYLLDDSYYWGRDYAKAHNIPFATYVFLGSDPRLQDEATDQFVADDIPVMVDWERSGCTFDEMMRYVTDLRAYGNRVPTLYTGKYFWQNAGSPSLAGLGLDLVVARYGDQDPTKVYDCEARYAYLLGRYGGTWSWDIGGLTPQMWQFGSRIRYGGMAVDMNAVLDPAFITRNFKDWTPPPPPAPTPDPLEDDMAWLIAKNAGNGDSWEASPDGRSRLHVPSQVHPDVVFACGRAYDVGGERWVTSFDPVLPVSSDQVAAKLGQRAR